jgi:ABC-type antimicrobial peptide transport system permease subunit
MEREYRFDNNPWGVILGLIIFLAVLFGMFWLAGQIMRLLWIIFPLFVIGAALLDYKVIVGYFRWLKKTTKKNLPLGIAAILLSVIGFPVVSVFWFWQAYRNYSLRKQRKSDAGDPLELGEYIDFEELEKREKQKLRDKDKGDGLEGMV